LPPNANIGFRDNGADSCTSRGEPRLVPAIYLAYWRIQHGVLPGIGKMMGYAYTLHDNTFEANWEIVEEK